MLRCLQSVPIFRKAILGILLSLLLVGCSNGGALENQESTVGSSVVQENKENMPAQVEEVWGVRSFTFEKEYSCLMLTEENIWGGYAEDGQAYVARLSKQDGAEEKRFPVSGMSYVKYLQMDKEGYLHVVGGDEDTGIYARVTTAGEIEGAWPLVFEDLEGLSKNEKSFRTRAIYTDGQGRTYIWQEMVILMTELMEDAEENVHAYVGRIYVKDEQMNTVYYEQQVHYGGMEVMDFQLDEESKPFWVIRDGEEVYRQLLDVEKQCLGEKQPLAWQEGVWPYMQAFQMEGGMGFCDTDSQQIWKYDYKEQDCKCIINPWQYGLGVWDMLCLSARENKVEIIRVNEGSYKQEYIVLSKGSVDKKLITLGSMWIEDDISRVVSEFNSQSEDLQIQLVSYWDGTGDYEDSLNRLKMDLISGKGPDIISVADAGLSILGQKGVYIDLYSFMDKDGECQKDMMTESILELYEFKGCLYNIAPAFYLYSMWGKEAAVQGRYGVGLKELKDILKAQGKDMDAIYGFYADQSTLTTLCTFGMDEIVDWEQGTCDFQGDYFAELMQFAKEYDEARARSINEGSIIKLAKNEKVVFSGGMISSVADYQIQRELFGGDIGLIGYPTAQGSGTAANFWGTQLAINALSSNQEAAWEFVKYFVLHGYTGNGFPLVKEQLEEVLAEAMQEERFASEDGTTTEKMLKGCLSTMDGDIIVYEASSEDVEAIRWMIENATQKMQRYMEIQDIIDEEAQAYFREQKSLEDTAAIIQSRVTLYLEEQLN